MRYKADDFKGVFTDIDATAVSMEVFKDAKNISYENGYVETKVIELTSETNTVPTPSADYTLIDLLPMSFRSDQLSETIDTTVTEAIVYAFEKVVTGTTYYQFIVQEGATAHILDKTADSMISIPRDAINGIVVNPIKLVDNQGVCEVYTDLGTFVIEKLNRTLVSYTNYSATENGAIAGAETLGEAYTGYNLDYLVKQADILSPIILCNNLIGGKYYADYVSPTNNYGIQATFKRTPNSLSTNANAYKVYYLGVGTTVAHVKSWQDGNNRHELYKVETTRGGKPYISVIIDFVNFVLLGDILSGWFTIQHSDPDLDITDYVQGGAFNGVAISATTDSYAKLDADNNISNVVGNHLSGGNYNETTAEYFNDASHRIASILAGEQNLYAGSLIKDLEDYAFSTAIDLNLRFLIGYNLSGRNVVFDPTVIYPDMTPGSDEDYVIDMTLNLPIGLSSQITEILIFCKRDLIVNGVTQIGQDFELIKVVKRLAYEIEEVDYEGSYHQFRELLQKVDLSGQYLQQIAGVYFNEKRPLLTVPITVQRSHTVADSFGFIIYQGGLYYSTVGYGIIQKNMFYPVTSIAIPDTALDLCKLGDDLGIFTKDGLKVLRVDNVESQPVFSFKRKLPHVKRSNVEVVSDSSLFVSNHGLFLLDGYEQENIGEAIFDQIKAATSITVFYNDYYQMIYLVLDTKLWQFNIKHKAWSQIDFTDFVKFYPGTKPIILKNDNTLYEVNYVSGIGEITFHPFNFGDVENYKRLYYLVVEKESDDYADEIPGTEADPDAEPPIEEVALTPMKGMKITVDSEVIYPTENGHKYLLNLKHPLTREMELKIEGTFKLKSLEIEYDLINFYKGRL
jgi:hypothetical protein